MGRREGGREEFGTLDVRYQGNVMFYCYTSCYVTFGNKRSEPVAVEYDIMG